MAFIQNATKVLIKENVKVAAQSKKKPTGQLVKFKCNRCRSIWEAINTVINVSDYNNYSLFLCKFM